MVETTQSYGQPVQAPASGQTVAIKAVPGQDIVLTAAFDQAEIRMEGGNVVFIFANGGQVVLDFTDPDYAQAPNVIMPDGSVLDMQEYLASLGEGEVEPAAGPDAGGADSGGVGEYRDDAGNLVEGVDKLGVLDPREFTSVVVESLNADPLAEEPGELEEPPVPENDVPVALDDLDFLDPSGTAKGNVMSGDSTVGGLGGGGADILGNDTPVTVTKVVGYEGEEDADFDINGDLSVNGQYGTLTIKADGSYEYTVNVEALEGPQPRDFVRNSENVTAFKFKESFFDEAGIFTTTGASGTVSTGGPSGAYFGVAGTVGQNKEVPAQINYSDSYSEALAFHFDAPVVSAQVGVSNMFKNENGGEAMRWHAFDADGVRIGTGVVSQNGGDDPYEGTQAITWTGGSSNVGTFTVSGIGVFSTLVFEAVPYGNDGFKASDNSDYFVRIFSYDVVSDEEIQDVFTYTITDSNGDSSEATLTISDLYGKGDLVNVAPVAVGNDYNLNDVQYHDYPSNGEESVAYDSVGVIRGNVITDDDDGGGAASGRDWDQDTPVLNLKVSKIFVDGEDDELVEYNLDGGFLDIDLNNGKLSIGDDGNFTYEVTGEGGDQFFYTIVDAHGAESDQALVNLLVFNQSEIV
ncbi:MAG: VCBS domain-containing protein [Desulfomicrobium sp.]|nr:VCBS domain-containing protein [Pseudomonadota bacterium]MBV1711289.1 VCBS domain-containing protein [Desulfomicrobium sp.]MBU4569960.1 VCBS domain-containing protein [Pseudomonadota bacterium]MBU4595059.1 VCBS domain-containing protein [Pseudomonadota bacterium]MBV1720640.1 VCBS domain-containing protein [Desulfomicrobium sp.]